MEKSEIETIYRKYFHDVFLYIRALSENESLAEEITQETFLKAMNNDHIHDILKKDEIKEVYVDKDGTTTTIWEAPEEEQKAYLSEEHTEPLG